MIQSNETKSHVLSENDSKMSQTQSHIIWGLRSGIDSQKDVVAHIICESHLVVGLLYGVLHEFSDVQLVFLYKRKILIYYRPQTNLQEGNVFTPVCDSVHGGVGGVGWGWYPSIQWAGSVTEMHPCFSKYLLIYRYTNG